MSWHSKSCPRIHLETRARWFLYVPVRVKSVTNGEAASGDRSARFAQRPVSSGGVESAQASMRPERGARPAGREQSVTRGHRCLSFTPCSRSSMLPPIWQAVKRNWQPVSGRRGLPLTASHSGTSRGKRTHTGLNWWVVLH